jgi:uncharacterized protein
MIKNLQQLKVLFLLLVLSSNVVISCAQGKEKINVRPRPNHPVNAVNDFANMLSPIERKKLENKLRQYYDSTTNEIVVITLPTIDSFDIAKVALAYGKSWRVGSKEKNNGIILMVSLQPRKIRIELGKGFESIISNEIAGEIIRNELVPQLKDNKYYEAFEKGINGLIKAAKGDYKIENSSSKND